MSGMRPGSIFVPEDFEEPDYLDQRNNGGKYLDGGKNVQLADFETVSYDKLLIATGANSFIPPVGDFPYSKKCLRSSPFVGCPCH